MTYQFLKLTTLGIGTPYAYVLRNELSEKDLVLSLNVAIVFICSKKEFDNPQTTSIPMTQPALYNSSRRACLCFNEAG